MVDYIEIADGICGVIAKVSTPLTDDQRLCLIGALPAFFEKAMRDERKASYERAMNMSFSD